MLNNVPKPISAYLYAEIKKLVPARVCVADSGAFDIEQIIRSASPDTEIYSCGRDLRTVAVGRYLTDTPLGIKFNPAIFDYFPKMHNAHSDEEITAAVLIISKMINAIEKADSIIYYQKLLNKAISEYDSIFNSTIKKLQRMKSKIGKIHFDISINDFSNFDLLILRPVASSGVFTRSIQKYFECDFELTESKTLPSASVPTYLVASERARLLPNGYEPAMIFQQRYHEFCAAFHST